jgi:glycosyltransferase involved in cell wall biosynthesis
MNPQPSISVIIPVYNGERYLQEAIQSVLDQTYPVHEIIVIDDGSTDRSVEIAQQFSQVTLLTQANRGAAAARNLGLQSAHGELIAFLDADDRWLPEKLAIQTNALIENPQVDIVFTHVQQFISPELAPEIQATLHCPAAPIAGVFPTTTLIRHAVWQRVGNFSEQFQVAEFIDWFNRSQALGLAALTLPMVLAQRRLHTTNSGIRLRPVGHKEYLELAKGMIARHRRTTPIVASLNQEN